MARTPAEKNDDHNPGVSYGSKGNKNTPDKPGTHGILLDVEGDWVTVREHLYRTADQRIVHENDRDGRWLAYPRGTRIKKEEAIRVGILKES